MIQSAQDNPQPGGGGFHSRPPRDFLNYFGKDRSIQLWLAHKRTALVSAVVPRAVRLGLVPDTISYVGIALIAGVVIYFVRRPVVAILFLVGHILCDGLDGAFARHAGKASQSGAFTDLVCDQLGMVAVAMMAIFHHLVQPVLGTAYISLYLIVVVFGVIMNVMELGTRITITSKYFLYAVYAIWGIWDVNYFSFLMTFFSAVMVVEVLVGYFRLKRGIRKKFDAPTRFAEGDSYTGRLNYVLNVSIPIAVFLVIVIGANLIPIRAMLATPQISVHWQKGETVLLDDETSQILGMGARDGVRYLMVRHEDSGIDVRKLNSHSGKFTEAFSVPEYIVPIFSSFPVDRGTLLVADRTTRLLMGFDLEASFQAKRAVIILTLPLGHLHVTAMTTAELRGKPVWLAANYLYTRKTYVVDPERAIKSGSLLGGVIASYTNAGFPSGMTFYDDYVMEYNSSPTSRIIYSARLEQLICGLNLLDLGKQNSFAPPNDNVIGPMREEHDLLMVSRDGQLYRLPIKAPLKNVTWHPTLKSLE